MGRAVLVHDEATRKRTQAIAECAARSTEEVNSRYDLADIEQREAEQGGISIWKHSEHWGKP
jgi:hypothetical protein